MVALKDLAAAGQVWQGVGDVFKKASWLPLVATVAQLPGYNQLWGLVSSVTVAPSLYKRRFHQKVSFRDLKCVVFNGIVPIGLCARDAAWAGSATRHGWPPISLEYLSVWSGAHS
ncbi:MAG: hypothetical protein H6672_02840 [Anaerolineaceae bacterium]|nr:hypothetical protein [Anaerolineaceae bacterium]